MKKHYRGLTERMRSELETISEQICHSGEKGRNNELVLGQFLERNLAQRYTVSTGKAVAAGGEQSGQVDLIVHDRLETPAFIEGRTWRLVPVESVHAMVSVKTTINRADLDDAMASVRTASRRHCLRAWPVTI